MPLTTTHARAPFPALATALVLFAALLPVLAVPRPAAALPDGLARSVRANLQAGDQQYGDRSFTLTSVPASLVGSAWIRTANDSKSARADPLATFTVSKDATVLVGVDTRLGRRPWMDASWTDTGMRLGNSESSSRSFELFAKNVDAGRVAIGPNADPANGSSMYTVVVTERAIG